jgi:GAF domain-containing protein
MGLSDRAQLFGDLLRRHRLGTGLTQVALAARANVSLRAVQHLEAGAGLPQRETIRRLVESLALDPVARAKFEMAAARTPRRHVEAPSSGMVAEPKLDGGPLDSRRQAVRNRAPTRLVEREAELASTVHALRQEAVELRRALNDRSRELVRALARHDITTDFLRIIAASSVELPPVQDVLVTRAAQLGLADTVFISRRENDKYVIAATRGPHKVLGLAHILNRGSITGRALSDGQPVHVACDWDMAEIEFPFTQVRYYGIGAMLCFPLLGEGAAIGTFGLMRRDRIAFTDEHIDLAAYFASHAVIVIENAKRLQELRSRSAGSLQ